MAGEMSVSGPPPPFQGPPGSYTPPSPPVAPRHPWRWVALGCGGAVLITVCLVAIVGVALLAGVARRRAVATASAVTPGQAVSVKNWEMIVTGVERPGQELVWNQSGDMSRASGTWVVVVLRMKNTGGANLGITAADFEMRDINGVRYGVSSDGGARSYSSYKGGWRVGDQVPPGVDVTYFIPFDVSPNVLGLQLMFSQDTVPTFVIGPSGP